MPEKESAFSPPPSNPDPSTWNPPPAPTQAKNTTETAESTATRHPGRGVGAAGTGVGSGMGQNIKEQMKRANDAIRRSFGTKDEPVGEAAGGMWLFP